MKFFDDSLITFRGDLVDFFEKNRGERFRSLCANCGFEFVNYAQSGRLGCSKCYDVFHEQILRQIQTISGGIKG